MNKMTNYKHFAYNLKTGEIINCQSGNSLKHRVALTQRMDKITYGVIGQWRFCHDFGKKWEINGFPKR